jgi:hypothetical protein
MSGKLMEMSSTADGSKDLAHAVSGMQKFSTPQFSKQYRAMRRLQAVYQKMSYSELSL